MSRRRQRKDTQERVLEPEWCWCGSWSKRLVELMRRVGFALFGRPRLWSSLLALLAPLSARPTARTSMEWPRSRGSMCRSPRMPSENAVGSLRSICMRPGVLSASACTVRAREQPPPVTRTDSCATRATPAAHTQQD
jgi:hypothetical protein